MRLFKKVLAISMATALAFTSAEMPVNATSNVVSQEGTVTELQTEVSASQSETTSDSTTTSEAKTATGDSTSTTEEGATTDKSTTDSSTTDKTTTDTTTTDKSTTDSTTTDKTTTDTTSETKSTEGVATTDKARDTAGDTKTTTTDQSTEVVKVSELQQKVNDALLVNGTVSLTQDVQLDKMLELKLPENIEKAEVTIELNGFKINSDSVQVLLHVASNVTLNIKGQGSIVSATDNGIVIFNEGIIALDNADLLATGTKSVGVLNNSELADKGLVIKSGTIKAEWLAVGKTAKAEASVKRPTAFFAVAGIVSATDTTADTTTTDGSATDSTKTDSTTTDSTKTDSTTTDTTKTDAATTDSTKTDNTTTDSTTTDSTTTDSTTINTDNLEQGVYSIGENATVTDNAENNISVITNTVTQDTKTQEDTSTKQGEVNNEAVAVPATQAAVVAPGMPVNVVATVNSYNSVKIAWSPVTDAQGYIIERSQTGVDASYVEMTRITATEYTDNTILVGKEYKYHIYAFTTNGSDVVKSAVSSDVTVKTTLAAPQSLNATQASTTSIQLTWAAVTGAQKYNVYRSVKGGEFSLLATVDGMEYTNTGLKTGTEYGYKVAAVSGDYVTDYSNTVTLNAAATAVTKLKASSKEYNKINLSWKKAKGATKYDIYRSTSETDGYKRIKTVTENKYTDSKIKTGVTYYYKVVSYSNKAKGAESSVVSATAINAAPTNVKAAYKNSYTAKITWTKVSGAGSYSIYRSTDKNSGYTQVGSVSKKKGSYTDKSAVAGTKYYYKVVAVSNGTEGKMSKAASVTIKPDAVKDLKAASAGGKSITLTWSASGNATSYEVFYSKKENSGYKKLGDTTNLSFGVNDLKNGRTYYYRVYAVTGGIQSNEAQTTYVNPKSISLSESAINLEAGDTAKLKVTFNPESPSNKTITWSSANTTIATVSDKGVVTALAKGVVIITATACNGVTATCEVGVDQETTGVVVVLDPGHGGSDPGAIAYGLKEKDLNLKISQYTKAELEKYSGVIVKMTRTDDTFIELEARTEIAKNYGADLFVSQHLNSAASSANGAEIYVSQNSKFNANSTKLGAGIVSRLTGVGLRNRGVQTKLSSDGVNDYYSVIRNSVSRGFPGIIVEGAFITGSEDIDILSTEGGLKSIGVATATAIAEYYGLSKK